MRVVVLLAMVVAGCKSGKATKSATPNTVTLSIAALNDFHGALYEARSRKDPEVAYGGLPWLVAAMESLRAEDPELLVLDGGDLYQGSWPVNASRGMGSIHAYNMLGVDVASVGNHEFDYGPAADGGHPLRGALELGATNAEFEWVAANIRTEDGALWQPPGIKPWTVVERKGVKIGVIGLTTTETPQTTLAKNVADLSFTDPVQAVRDALPALEAAGAQVVAVVGHLTGECEPASYTDVPDDCKPDGEIGRLLTELPAGTIDVMVVGHAHTLMASRYEDTFVLESRAKGHMIGRLDLVVGPDGVDADASVVHPPWVLAHTPVDPGCEGTAFPTAPLEVGGRTLTPSAEALALISRLESEAGSLCDEVGCAQTALGRAYQGESGVGVVVSDAMLAVFDDADLAVQNSGGLRADLPGGRLRREHIQMVMPFDNRVLLVELTGEQVLMLLRVGSSGAHGILELAGGSYQFDPAATGGSDLNGDGELEKWETHRICSDTVVVDGVAIDPARTYKVATTDFLYTGGDHLGPVFDGAPVVEEGPLLREAIIAYVEGLEQCLGEAFPLPDPARPRIREGTCDG